MAYGARPAEGMSIDQARERVQSIYRTNPRIRMNVAIAHSKVVQDAEGVIIGVYPHVFCVEENSCGTPRRHTFQYADLLTRRIEICEQL